MITPPAWKNIFESDLLKAIEEVGVKKTLAPGTVAMESGKTIRIIPILLKGTMRVTRKDETGKELLLYYVHANESCAMTFTCCMQTKKSEVSTIAEEEVELVAIPVRYMDLWMSRFKTWRSFVMNTIEDRLEELLRTLDLIAFQKLDVRLVNYLKDKSEATGSEVLYLSHEQIASEMATSREVISRLLKKLEEDHRIHLSRKEIRLLDLNEI